MCVCVCVRACAQHSRESRDFVSLLLSRTQTWFCLQVRCQPARQPARPSTLNWQPNRQAVSAASRPFPFRPESCLVSIRLVVFPPQLSSVDHFLLLLTSFASSASANLSLHFGLSFLSGCVDIWLLDKIVSNRPRPEVLASRFLAHLHHPSRQHFAPKKRWLVIVFRP